jgi:hypothetical protein
MCSIQNYSLYIPSLFDSVNEQLIIQVFEVLRIGQVAYVDIIQKKNNYGDTYKSAYIHFDSWFDNNTTRNLQMKLNKVDGESRIIYDEPNYWVIQKSSILNKITQRGMRIQLDDTDKEINKIIKNKINIKSCFIKKSTDDNDDEKLNRIERELNGKSNNDVVDIGYLKILEDKICSLEKELGILKQENKYLKIECKALWELYKNSNEN